MKKQLLAVSLISLLTLGFAGSANADPSGNSVLTGTMAGTYTVTPAAGAATISSTDGALTGVTNPSFGIVANTTNYRLIISAVAPTTGGTRQAIANPSSAAAGKVRLAISRAIATNGAVDDALLPTPTAATNANVIAYDITFAGTTGGDATFDQAITGADLIGVGNVTETTVTGTVATTPVTDTFATATDTAGIYKATITLAASDL